MSDLRDNLKKRKEFVIFEKENHNSFNINKEKEGIKKLKQKATEQEFKLNERLKKIKRDEEQRKAKKQEQKEEKKKLDSLSQMTTNQLFKMAAIWPFDLFPNKVFIEEKQVIIKYKQFFFTSQEYHILIQDILVPIVENSLLFSSLKIQIGTGGFQQDPPPVHHLPKKDALLAKHIIMGLLVCHKEDINLDEIEKEELIKKLVEIGRYRKE